MNIVTVLFILYFIIGLIVLSVFELITKRISNRIKVASAEAQLKMAERGGIVNYKTAMVMTLLSIWLFYPLVIYAAITSKKGDINGESK